MFSVAHRIRGFSPTITPLSCDGMIADAWRGRYTQKRKTCSNQDTIHQWWRASRSLYGTPGKGQLNSHDCSWNIRSNGRLILRFRGKLRFPELSPFSSRNVEGHGQFTKFPVEEKHSNWGYCSPAFQFNPWPLKQRMSQRTSGPFR